MKKQLKSLAAMSAALLTLGFNSGTQAADLHNGQDASSFQSTGEITGYRYRAGDTSMGSSDSGVYGRSAPRATSTDGFHRGQDASGIQSTADIRNMLNSVSDRWTTSGMLGRVAPDDDYVVTDTYLLMFDDEGSANTYNLYDVYIVE